MAPSSDDDLHDLAHPALGKNIDIQELGLVLSEALIRRLGRFRPSQRRDTLRVIRERLLKEGGVYFEFLTGRWSE